MQAAARLGRGDFGNATHAAAFAATHGRRSAHAAARRPAALRRGDGR